MVATVRARRAHPFARLRVPEGRDPSIFWRSINRLAAAHAVAIWRAGNGEVPADTSNYVEVVCDALRHADGGGRRYVFDVIAIRDYWLPGKWHDAISDDQIYDVLLDVQRTRPPHELMGAREAGRLLGLHLAEIEELRAGGTNVPFCPVDLSAEENAARQRDWRRAGWREASRRYREKKVATERHRFPQRGEDDASCNFSQADAVRAAIDGGAGTVGEVVAATGFPTTSVKPILSRLAKSGAITRPARGRYAPAGVGAGCGAEPHGHETVPHGTVPQVVAAASESAIAQSGPSIPPEPPEPAAEVERTTSSMPTASRPQRALQGRVAVGASPHTPGPDGSMRLAPTPLLHPCQPAFSRLPGTLFMHFNRRKHDAPSRCA